MIGCVRLPTMLSDEFLQAVLADVTFHLGSIAENRPVAADKFNVLKFLGFEVVGCILALADVADHRIGFLYCLLDLFVSDHFCLSTSNYMGSYIKRIRLEKRTQAVAIRFKLPISMDCSAFQRSYWS